MRRTMRSTGRVAVPALLVLADTLGSIQPAQAR